MTADKIPSALAKMLNVNIESLAKKAGANEHNVREEWEATTRKVTEFSTKYIETTAATGASAS